MNDFCIRAKVYAFNRNINRYEHKWIEGYLTPISITEQGPQFVITEPVKGECVYDHHYYNGDDRFSFKPVEYAMFTKETISRWTGLHDKNGTKIWEGDILKWETYGDAYIYLLVEFDGGRYIARACDPDIRHNTIKLYGEEGYSEVIGNKWDNPELLEG